jgi:hypothetical protein
MNIFMPKKEVTLESVSQSVESIVKSIDSLTSKMVTKDDLKRELKGFATTDDLKAFATKDDLKNELKAFATRTEMDEWFDNMAIAVNKGFVATDKRIDLLEQRLDEKIDRIDVRLTNQLDYVLTHYARREEYNNLDLRTKKLEKAVFA